MSNKRIIILTGSEMRHDFFRKFMALQPRLTVLRSYCEGREKSLEALVEADERSGSLRKRHLAARACSERDFFNVFVQLSQDHSNPSFIPKGDINLPQHVEEIIELEPDLLISYGCSIIRSQLLEEFAGRFVNIHLGLSPWYRGSGTNFWPLVNGEPEYVGATFMHIDAGVDTGDIIHQIRARICWGDTPHTIGNRLIADMAATCAELIRRFDKLQRLPQPATPENARYYRKKDFDEDSVRRLYDNLCNGMIERYISEKCRRDEEASILCNPAMDDFMNG